MKKVIRRFNQFFLLTILLITSTSFLFGQGWERTFGGNVEDQALEVLQTIDGGYALVGFSESQGRFGSNVTLVKTNELGEKEWSQSYGLEGDDKGYDFVQEASGDYVIVGQTTSETDNSNDILLIKVDSKGKLLWQKAYGGSENDQGRSLAIAQDGGYYITGRREYDGNSDLYLLKVDINGEVVWERRFGGDKTEEGYSVIETSIGEVVVVGITRSFVNSSTNSPDIYFIKTKATGETIIEAKYGNLELDQAKSVVETLDGGFALTGTVTNRGDLLLMRLDREGKELWSKTYGDPSFREVGNSIALTPDGGFIIVGSNAITDRLTQIFLLRTDDKGEELWNRLYGGAGYNDGNAVKTTTDGGYIIAGNYDINTDPNSLLPLNDMYLAKASPDGNISANIIKGKVYRDRNSNCELDAGEKVLEDWLVQVRQEDNIIYATTDKDGAYELALPDGNYSVGLVVLNKAWDVCQNYNINFNTRDTIILDFAARATVEDCPVVVADVSAPFLEPCRTTDYTVSLCNRGVAIAEDAYIDVQFDRDLKVNFSTLPWSNYTGDTYRFNIGDLAIEECGDFKVNVTVGCDAEIGKTHCVEAYAFPNALCIPPPPTWNGASIRVDGECLGDSIIFTITNIGDGDMTAPSEFIIIEENVAFRQNVTFQLPSRGSETIKLPADGSTIRLIADQPNGHPYGETATAVMEGCPFGRPFTTGFVTQFSDSDDLPFYSADCQENRVVTGRVDLTASPKGLGTEGFIAANDALEYHIFFQNTGSDSINRVIIRDTLSKLFDITQVVPGASSHAYNHEITGEGVLKFTFENIDLPNLVTNEQASHGFIKFRVTQKLNTPQGAVIENKASVTFDFGAPILTETTIHTVGGAKVIDYVEVITDTENVTIPGVKVNVYPNPFVESATVEIEGIGERPNLEFQLFDVTGKLVQTDSHKIPNFRFYPKQLPGGMYFFSILHEGQLLTSGKVFIK